MDWFYSCNSTKYKPSGNLYIDNILVYANWSVISIGDYLGDLSLISHQSTLNSQLQGIQAEAQLEFAMHSKELLKVMAY